MDLDEKAPFLWYIIGVILLIFLIIFCIYINGDINARQHTKEINCEHNFINIYEYHLFRGEKPVSVCTKCGMKEE